MATTTLTDGWSSGHSKRPESVLGSALFDLVMHIPASAEPASADPAARAARISSAAARRAAAMSGALALPPGPLGLLTVLPDLIGIWKIQQQMVVDIAAAFGARAQLRREVMIYCLFKHGSAALFRDLVVRAGERVLVREASLRAVQQMLQKIGVRISQRILGRSLARWIPVVGAIGTGAYAYYDTRQVAATAIAFFSQQPPPPPPPLVSSDAGEPTST